MKTSSLHDTSIKNYKQGLKTSQNFGNYFSDRESFTSKGKRNKIRRNSSSSMKSNKLSVKKRSMDFTNHAYREAVNRLKYLLAESYTTSDRSRYSYGKQDDSGDDQSENQSISTKGTDRPALSEISKYLSPSYKFSSRNPLRKFKNYSSLSKENLSVPTYTTAADYLTSTQTNVIDSAQTPPEVLNFIEKQENYIEQLEKESSFCRNELSNLLGKVKDVISENEALTEHARSDFSTINKSSSSSDSEETVIRKRDKSNKTHLSTSNIVTESRISQLEAELTQASIDLKKVRMENDELKRKITFGDTNPGNIGTGDALRRQVDNLQRDKLNLEEQIKKLQNTIEDLRSDTNRCTSKRHRDITDIAIFEKSQAEIEVKHLRDELERQHERIRELQHEMARRIAEERTNAERRYNFQVDQLGGDLSNQWEHASKLQIDLERQKRIEADLKRDLSQKNAQIDDLKAELKAKRAGFLSDIAQLNAEKQSLEQEATSLRLQLERSERQAKVENARLNAEINSLRQRLDRADADILHSKRENLRLTDEIANLEKELTLGEMKNEVRPTTRDLNKTITEIQQKHEGTVHELEEMIQSQRQLMDKLTNECKTLTNKLEDSTLKHNGEKQELRKTNEMLLFRLQQIWIYYKKSNMLTLSNNDTESSHEEQNINQHRTITNHHLALQKTELHQSQIKEQMKNHHHLQKISPMTSKPHQNYLSLQNQEMTSSQTKNQSMEQQPTNTETTKISKIVLEKETNLEIKKNSIPHPHTSKIKTTTMQMIPKTNNIPYNLQNQAIQANTKETMTNQNTINNNLMIPDMKQIMMINNINNMKETSSTSGISSIREINNSVEINNTNHIKQVISNTNQATNQQNMVKPQNMILEHMDNNNLFQSQHQQVPFQQRVPSQQQVSRQKVVSPQQQYPQQNEKAVFNRKRAMELWGLQAQEEVEGRKDQTFCQDSLPRLLKDYLPQQQGLSENEIDPYDLIPEFGMSSPSLFEKSSDSDFSSEISESTSKPTTRKMF